MNENDTFTAELFQAMDEKISWYDSVELPKLLTLYRHLHSHITNLITTLEKKGLISPDPYKHDKKIVDVSSPDEGPFADSERSVVIGSRLSDYESILDFICNYLKFSVASIPAERIKKLTSLNNSFQWNSVVPTSAKSNTKGLAEIVNAIRQGADTLSISVVNDCIINCSKIIAEINTMLKDLSDFQREVYKVEVRKTVFEHPSFSAEKAKESVNAALHQIKKLFPAVLGTRPFYTELIEEIVQEEFAADKEEKRRNLLARLTVTENGSVRKEKTINPKANLMDAVRTLASIEPQLEQVLAKIDENKKILDSEHDSFWKKLMAVVRKAFNIQEEPVTYKLIITDPLTQSKKNELIIFQDFYAEILKRSRYYASFSVKKSPGYQKIETMPDEQILELIITQLAECQKLLVTLNALDEFFKTTAMPLNRSRIKGIKMEITAIKNSLVKTNQRKAEYASLVEEQMQMRRLGMIHA